jgi:hypothetical protein
MSQDKDQFDFENPAHHRLPGSTIFIDTTGGKFTARNVPAPLPTPQPQATTIAPQPKPPEDGGRSL